MEQHLGEATLNRKAGGGPAYPPIPPTKRDRRRTLKSAALLALGGVGLAYGIRGAILSWASEATDNAQVEAPIVKIEPKVPGFVERILVEENDRVKAGDTLLILDGMEKRVQVKAAEAALAEARTASQDGSGRAGVSLARVQGGIARQNVRAAQAEYERALREARRARSLASRDILPSSQLEAAEAGLIRARAALKAAREQARGSDLGVVEAKAQLRSADARLLAAQAGLEAARLQLAYTVITAPRGGIVTKKAVEAGQLVAVGQPLMALVDVDSLWVVANFKETQIAGIASGQNARIRIDAYPGREIPGVVRSIQPATGSRFALLAQDNASANFVRVVQRIPVKIALAGPGREGLRPGMSADVRISTR